MDWDILGLAIVMVIFAPWVFFFLCDLLMLGSPGVDDDFKGTLPPMPPIEEEERD